MFHGRVRYQKFSFHWTSHNRLRLEWWDKKNNTLNFSRVNDWWVHIQANNLTIYVEEVRPEEEEEVVEVRLRLWEQMITWTKRFFGRCSKTREWCTGCLQPIAGLHEMQMWTTNNYVQHGTFYCVWGLALITKTIRENNNRIIRRFYYIR